MSPGPHGEARFDLAVVGAGAVGASVALELGRRGADVVVLEAGSGWAAECSRGNAGIICPSHSGAFATAADLAQAVRWLLRRGSPLRIVPSPRRLPWLMRLAAGSRPSREREILAVMVPLAARSLELHAELAARGLNPGFRQAGLLDVYETEAGLRRGRVLAQLAPKAALEPRELSRDEVSEAEPELRPGIAGAFLYPHEAHCDPLAFVEAVGREAQRLGAKLVTRARVLSIDRDGSAVRLRTAGSTLRAERVVVAAGSWSRQLAASLGADIPVEPGKGYAVDVRTSAAVRRPMIFNGSRVAVTPFDGRVRLAGAMEFGGLDAAVQPKRAEAVRRAGVAVLPGLRGALTITSWAGLRPCAPDQLPLVGWVDARQDVMLATGHAMLGITLAPVTGELVSELLGGATPEEARPLSPTRFRS